MIYWDEGSPIKDVCMSVWGRGQNGPKFVNAIYQITFEKVKGPQGFKNQSFVDAP